VNSRVADPSVPAVIQAQHSHQGICDVFYVTLPGHTSDASLRGTSLCSKSECFFYGECGEMDVVFGDELQTRDVRCGGQEEPGGIPVGHHDSVPSSRLE